MVAEYQQALLVGKHHCNAERRGIEIQSTKKKKISQRMTTLCEEKGVCPLVAACRITLDYTTNDIKLCSL